MCNRQNGIVEPVRTRRLGCVFHLCFKGVTPNSFFAKLENFKLTKKLLSPLYKALILIVNM